MQGAFTKRKFTTLSTAQRHKKCAELLRSACRNLADNTDASQFLSTYSELASWLQISPLEAADFQVVSDRYHKHAAIADIHHKEHNLLPSIRQGDRLSADPAWPIAIYLDNIRSAHNVGSILRTVEAFSLGSVYFSSTTPYVDHKQVKDAAMGATEWVQCQKASLSSLPRPLFAMETSSKAENIFEFDFPDSFSIAVGNEEYGCSAETLTTADAIIEIPLRGKKNSLNVANAFAVAAAEIYRQRAKAGKKL